MKVLVSGASGLIGKALCDSLHQSGDTVYRLVRDEKQVSENAIFWNPEQGIIDHEALEGFDAVVNLAGENIGSRWTPSKKRQILESRVKSTKTLADALMKLAQPPHVLITASAIGYYGDQGGEMCIETSPSGTGFLADVCRQWEAAASPAETKGIRTVYLRIGIVLSPNGGALAKMLPIFRFGMGGILGSGKQFMSWIAIEDLIGIIQFALIHGIGPINAVAPVPVTNEVFTKTLGDLLNRPTPFPVPAVLLKMVFGKEMAEDIFLGSTRVSPAKILSEGYLFKYPDLQSALKALLKQGEKMKPHEGQKSDKSFVATLLFCLLLGTLGVHRFYVGKIGTGILMLITLGGFGLWMLIDFILIVSMRFRDKEGFYIEP